MKIKLWLVCLWSVSSLFVYADEKIYHMIYAESQPAPFNKNEDEQENKDLVYCIKTDNNLYVADVTKKEQVEYKEEPIKLYTLKKQQETTVDEIIQNKQLTNDNIEPVEGRLMLIGQPVLYLNYWVMPAVVKRKYFGFLQSTDVCIIVRKVIGNTNYKPHPKTASGSFSVSFTTEYIVYKIADGHRTLANFVGIIAMTPKNVLLLSSSRWPTSKIVNLHRPTDETTKPDNDYFLDSNLKNESFFYLSARVLKSFFNQKQVKSLFLSKKKNSKRMEEIKILLENVYVHFLPKISLNPDFVYKSSSEVIKNTLTKVLLDKRLQSKNSRYKVYVLAKDQAFFVPTNQTHEDATNLSGEELKVITEDRVITASAYDFDNNRLIVARYNETSKKASFVIFYKEYHLN